MSILKDLQKEMENKPSGVFCPDFYRCKGYEKSKSKSPSMMRADGIYALFTEPEPYIYKNDLIVGSIKPYFVSLNEDETENIKSFMSKYPERGFFQNGDHFAPDYFTAVEKGIPGLLKSIDESVISHSDDNKKIDF